MNWVVRREHEDAHRHDQERFARLTDHVHARLVERLNQNRFLLESVRSTFLASSFVSEEEFETLVASLNIEEKFPATSGIGFIRNTGGRALEGCKVDLDKVVFDYFVSPSGDPPPAADDRDWSDTLTGSAMARSDVISRTQSINDSPGFFWLDPITMPAETGPKRLQGWIYAVVSLPAITEELTEHVHDEVEFQLTELSSRKAVWKSAAPPEPLLSDESNKLVEVRHVKLGGHSWVITTWASPEFEPTTSSANAAGFWGVLISVAIALLVYSLINSRARAEQIAEAKTAALAESEHKLRDAATRSELALEGGGLGLWDWDIPTGRVVVDKRTCEMVGEEFDDGLRDLAWFKLWLHPDDWEPMLELVDRHFNDPSFHYDTEFRMGNEETGYRWIRSCGRVVERDATGAPIRMSGTHADVTERVEAAAATREQTNRAESLAQIITESPNELYILCRDDLRFVEVNDGAVTASGYTREELLRMNAAEITPDYEPESLLKKFQALKDGSSRVIEFQTRHQRKDKSTYPVQISLHNAVYNGQPVYVAFVTDLTETRRLESGLAQARRLESLGELAAGIAHEINTPMQCVAGNIDYLSDSQERVFRLIDALLQTLDSEPSSWDERKRAVEAAVSHAKYDRLKEQVPAALADVAEASRRVVETVRAMKAMSHPGTPGKCAVDINTLVRNATTITRNRWRYSSDLRLDLDETLPKIAGLQNELSQVLINLIVNAADAIIEKNGENGPRGEITVTTRRKGDIAVVEVGDTGTGVPESIRGKLYDPFFTTKEVGKGTGQGLAITYDIIVNKHGGEIDLYSTDGEGAAFVLHLPIGADLDVDESDETEQAMIV